MTSFNKRVFEMLIRVQVFAQRFPHLFQEGSVTVRLIQDIDKAVQKFSAEKSSQTSGDEDRKAATEARSSARRELKSQLQAISRTAQGLELPGFWLPRDRSDRDLIDAGYTLAIRAEPVKGLFIESHMPLDFIEQLKGAAQDLEKAIHIEIQTS